MTSAHLWTEYLDELRRRRVRLGGMVEVVLYRDPDGRGADGVDVRVFMAGEPVEAQLVVVDPGAGHTLAGWLADRDAALADASPAAAEVITEFYADGADTEFIEDDRG